jgi:uncharacterized protein (TIGR02452 family)
MPRRAHLAEIARETLDLLDQGNYVSPGGARVTIGPLLQQARAGTIHYTPEDFADVHRRRDELLRDLPRTTTTFEVVNCTTLAAARSLVCSSDRGVLALNFASAKHPGGGFRSGSQAQEESLARSSGLYACIAPMRLMYETNKGCATALYTDHMIYSPAVPVIRDDEGNLLAEPYPVSFLTAPAVNVGALKRNETSRIAVTMLARMEKLLSVAVVHGHATLILGAWGCGVFRNDPLQVAGWFRHHLMDNPTFAGVFEHVLFAILDWSPERRFIEPFEKQFSPCD